MKQPVIASIPCLVHGFETHREFLLLTGNPPDWTVTWPCMVCGTYFFDRATPVVLCDGGEIDADATEAFRPLCRACSFTRAGRIYASWGCSLQTSDVQAIWRQLNTAVAVADIADGGRSIEHFQKQLLSGGAEINNHAS